MSVGSILAINWADRRKPVHVRPGFGQLMCPTCSHVYSRGRYRSHLRSVMHRSERGWWDR